MLRIKNLEVYGLEKALYSSGLPMRTNIEFGETFDTGIKRGKRLGQVKNGSGHDNFLKGIIVQFDLYYPEYFSPQLQRYHWIDIVSSMSKMHMITNMDIYENCNDYVDIKVIEVVQEYIDMWKSEENKDKKQDLFMRIISNLPMGFSKWMSISTNYLQLKTIYTQRKSHKLPEWKYFCETMKNRLPSFKELVIGEKDV